MPPRLPWFLAVATVTAAITATPAWAKPPAKGGKAQKSGQKAATDKKKGTKPPPPPAKAAAAPPASTPAKADAKATAKAAPPLEWNLTIQRATLDNGLRVVLNPDRTSPTVAIAVTYDVGSRDEERGRSGFAHLFEHMMFQGSRNVDKGEHPRLISGHGGILNGTTNTDRTNYFEVLPSNELALGLWLEADRMKSLNVNAVNFENQRKIVQEEYRMGVSNVAYAPSAIRLEELVYQGYWPYEHSTIGSMADLDGAKIEWVQDFHARFYGPNNAVLTIVGDFEPEAAMGLVHRYFDGASKINVTPYKEAPLPEQTSQRTAVIHDDNARTPGIHYGWAIPPVRAADHYPLEATSLLLGNGESSRLYQLLVRDKAVAQEINVRVEHRRGPDIFTIDATLVEGAKVGDVEKLVEGEIKSLATKGPSDAEIEKARRQIQSRMIFSLSRNVARAVVLGEYEVFFGDARLLNAELPRYLAVTKDDIKRVTAQYLGPTRRSLVETYPAAAKTAEKPEAKAAAVHAEPKAEAKKGHKPAAPGDGPKAKKGGGAAAPAGKPKKLKK
jgi:zinc protease